MPQIPTVQRGGRVGGGKQGRFVILRFPLFWSVWGSQGKMLRKTARKMSLSHPFLRAPSASKNQDLRAVSPNASRQSTGKMTNRPHFALPFTPNFLQINSPPVFFCYFFVFFKGIRCGTDFFCNSHALLGESRGYCTKTKQEWPDSGSTLENIFCNFYEINSSQDFLFCIATSLVLMVCRGGEGLGIL